jgi:AbrB family looped-hinge helix DNA binding protein
MDRLLLQVDDRGRITIPAELRKRWHIKTGDYLVIDPEDKNICKAYVITDEETKDPKIVKSLLQLGEKAKEDFYKGETININDYVAESKNKDEF